MARWSWHGLRIRGLGIVERLNDMASVARLAQSAFGGAHQTASEVLALTFSLDVIQDRTVVGR